MPSVPPTAPPIQRPVARPRSQSAGGRRSPIVDGALWVVLVALLAALIFLFGYCASCFDVGYNAGQWLDLGAGILMITLLPLCAGAALALALILKARGADPNVATVAMGVAVIFGCPLTSFPLAHVMSAGAATLFQPYKNNAEAKRQAREMAEVTRKNDARNEAAAHHFDSLRARFREPQHIARVEHGLIMLDDGAVLSLYGVSRDANMMLRLKRSESEVLQGGEVMIRLPERPWFLREYFPDPPGEPPSRGDEALFAGSPTDASGWRYGRIPALVYVDGSLLNARFADRSGFNTFEQYEKPPTRGE